MFQLLFRSKLTAFIIAYFKLYYLFSCGYDKEKIKQAMEEDLRGEISVP